MAQSYTRQSTFADGDTISASLFNNEYNQLLNSFAYSSTSAVNTGHRHDGTAGQGGNIFKIGDLDFLNKIEVDGTNNRLGFYVEVSSAAVEQIRIQDGAIVPVTDNDIDLGTSSLEFKDLYIDGTANLDSLVLGSGSTVTAILDEDDLSSDSATSLATQQSIKAYVDAQVTAQDFDFSADSGGSLSIDLDSEVMTFTGGTGIDTSGSGNAVTFAIDSTVATLTGSQTLTNKTITSPDINGGTVDGATIATSNITVGSGKTLDVSAGTLTLADNQISGDKVEGGTIAATTITDLTFGSLDDGTITVTAFVDEDNMASDSATLVPTQQSVKAYVDAQVTAQDLDVTTDSGTIAIDLDSENLTVTGGTGIDSSATGNAVTLAIDSTVATLTGSQTLTNKTLTAPVVSGNLTTDGLLDGRDVATDGSKLDGIEASADVTDTTNVTAAGALMDSEVTNLAQVKAFDSSDYATAAQGTTADAALPRTGGAMTGAITTNSTFDGRDVATDGAKLDGIEASADVTDTANVTAAGALMDSELTAIASVKALNQGVATTDSPAFTNLTLNGTGSVKVPAGTTAQRDGSPAAGMFRYNSSLAQFEGYTDAWGSIGGGGTNTFTTDSFTGNGSTTAYALSQTVSSEDNLLVFIEGVFQQQDAYSIATAGGTTTLTFSSAPANGNSILIYSVAAGVSGSNLNIDSMTGDGSDTTLTLSINPVNENNTQVFIDGVYQSKSNYSISGTTLTFSTAPPTGSAVEVMTMTQTDINVPVDGTITSAKLSGDLTLPGDLSFADNNKAIFGAGSDLQIYHNGSNSFIEEAGTGSLYVRANTDFRVQSYSDNEEMIRATANGAVTLYNNNSAKLATTSTGIDVTGTVTADGGTIVSTGSDAFSSKAVGGYAIQAYQDATSSGHTALDLRSDATTNTRYLIRGYNDAAGTPTEVFSVGADGTVTADGLTVDGSATEVKFTTSAGRMDLFLTDTDTTDGQVRLRGDANSLSFITDTKVRQNIASNGDISFYEDTGTTPKFFWDASAERLGVGTTNIEGAVTAYGNSDTIPAFSMVSDTNHGMHILHRGTDGDFSFEREDAGTKSEFMRVDRSSGNVSFNESVGIGTSSPTGKLDVTISTNARLYISDNISEVGSGNFAFQVTNSAGTSLKPMGFRAEDIRFATGSSERLRIDSSGNLLVGTTAAPTGSTGGSAFIAESVGRKTLKIASTTTGGAGLAEFINPNGVVGSISTSGSATTYSTSSDQRLKENITDADDAGSKVDAIQVRKFDWIADGSHQDYGMIAQELQAVAPEAVSGDADSDEMMGVDYSKLVPMLVKEIQSLRTRVQELENN